MDTAIREYMVDKYCDLYVDDQFTLAASSAIYMPYFVCTITCLYVMNQPMTSLDSMVCRCIEQTINRSEDIAFVLALEDSIVQEVVQVLTNAGILNIEEGVLAFTEEGKTAYKEQCKSQQFKQQYEIYMNGITGEWTTEMPQLSELKNLEEVICLQPNRIVDQRELEQYGYLWERLEQQYLIRIIDVKLMEYKKIKYLERYILLYKNINKKIKFNIYDLERDELDIGMNTILLKGYEQRRLYEFMQIEQYIQSEDEILHQYQQPLVKHQYYRNRELRELFKNIFQIAQKSILIVSPWINNKGYVMTKSFIEEMESALRDKKLEITIGYGYPSKEKMNQIVYRYQTSKHDPQWEKDSDLQTAQMAEKLKKRFAKYPSFSIRYMGTHEKILCYDERYTVVGSFNFLSYDGGEHRQYSGYNFRLEGGVLIDDPAFARYILAKVKEESNLPMRNMFTDQKI